MLRFSGRRRRQMMINAEINITNLVDVAFVLLIIFMITAPILQGGIEVELPQTYATPLTDQETVILTVDAAGDRYVEDVKVESEDELRALLEARLASNPDMSVTVKGDRNVPHGNPIDVMGILKDVGITKVSIVVETRRRGS